MECLELTDVWRAMHPSTRRYTWNSAKSTQRARLDFFLVSQDIYALTKASMIQTGYRTDHALVLIELDLGNIKRGKGFGN